MTVAPIAAPLPGEHLAATSPTMLPEADAGFRMRLNFWAGRTLTAEALQLEQEHRAGHLAWQGRIGTAGIVTGLEVALEEPAVIPPALAAAGHFLHLAPGHGFTVYGEDITVPRPLRIPLDQIPIQYVRLIAGEPAPAGATPSPAQGLNGLPVTVDSFPGDHLPWAAVLVARPAEVAALGNGDPTDPCELDPSSDAFADERRLDAMELRLIQLPAAWEADPLLAARADPRWRNRLAHYVFSAERDGAVRQYLRFLATDPKGAQWNTVSAEADLFPWELAGVPLALLSSQVEAGATRFFLDRASVARPGGRARSRTRPAARLATTDIPPGAGTPALWRAQVDQFAEHLSGLTETDPAAQVAHFQFVPPAGLLPIATLDLLTTDEALILPPAAGQPPDRAAISRFFPQRFSVEAVPIPIEDLDAALAAGAPLAPYDLAAPEGDAVRMLVPVAQRVFDPRLLVVELEDPLFATEVARLIAVRQDWRQRRDFVQNRHDVLRKLVEGPQLALPAPALESGQLEPEPVETFPAPLQFGSLYLSPADTSGPWEISAGVATALTAATVLFVRLRLDLDHPPTRIEIRWRVGAAVFTHAWTAPSDAPVELRDPAGAPLAEPLWRLYTVTAAELGVTSGSLTGFTLHLDDGRIGLIDVGTGAAEPDLLVLWNGQTAPPPTFQGGDWTLITDNSQLPAPFEPPFALTFPDGTLDARLAELPKLAPENNQPAQGLADLGLQKLLAGLQRQLDRADDFVDMSFLTAQANTHRIRQVLLGDDVADDLLISPILSSVVKRSSALVAEEDLLTVLKAAKAEQAAQPGGAVVRSRVLESTTVLSRVNFEQVPILKSTIAVSERTNPLLAARQVSQPVDDIRQAEPAVGQGFELRTLTVAKRFDAGPVQNAYDFADVGMREVIAQLVNFDLGFSGAEFIPDVTTGANNSRVAFRDVASGKIKIDALKFSESATPDPAGTPPNDTSSILAKGIRRADATVLILRRFEYYIALRRAVIARGGEVLAAARAQITAAETRLAAIASPLAEARQDVSVARALRQEEQQRVADINTRRDDLIRDEVKFLAYVRPRAIDPAFRRVPGWRLDSPETASPVPACLQRHDQPPEALHAYVQLFNHAPAIWFTDIGPRLGELDTREKLSELLLATQRSALTFTAEQRVPFAQNVTIPAARNALLSAYTIVEPSRTSAAALQILQPAQVSWNDLRRQAELNSSLGDIIGGRHGDPSLAQAAANLLAQIEEVATCLHAEFAAVPAAIRLTWVERYSAYDRPAPLNDLTVLPRYGSLDREARRRFQAFADWLFQRVDTHQPDAFNLINDLIRICLLLASYAPVQSLIAGHVPRPILVRPGVMFPIRPFDPKLVRVGMEVHVWRANELVAQGRVADLIDGDVSARMERVLTATTSTTLDETMRVQFIPAALGIATPL